MYKQPSTTLSLYIEDVDKTISKIKQDDKELDTNKTSSYLHSTLPLERSTSLLICMHMHPSHDCSRYGHCCFSHSLKVSHPSRLLHHCQTQHSYELCKLRLRQCLCEDIRKVLCSWYVFHFNLSIFNHLMNEMVPQVNMLRP
jgi:hypothetical protein